MLSVTFRQLNPGSFLDSGRARFFRAGVFSFSKAELAGQGLDLTKYSDPVRVYVSKEELETDAVKIKNVPLTIGHSFIDEENWRSNAVGDITDSYVEDEFISGVPLIRDADAKRRIKKENLKYFSVGFFAPLIDSPGTSEFGDYDVVFGDKEFNHVAYCSNPRAGEECTYFSVNNGERMTPEQIQEIIEKVTENVTGKLAASFAKEPETVEKVVEKVVEVFDEKQAIQYSDTRSRLIAIASAHKVSFENKTNGEIAHAINVFAKNPILDTDSDDIKIRFALTVKLPSQSKEFSRSYDSGKIPNTFESLDDEANAVADKIVNPGGK